MKRLRLAFIAGLSVASMLCATAVLAAPASAPAAKAASKPAGKVAGKGTGKVATQPPPAKQGKPAKQYQYTIEGGC